MNEVVLFENKDFGNIRVLGNYLNPLFCLSDICKILNVKRVNSIRDMIDREFDKGGVFEYTPFQTRGGKQICKGVVKHHPLSTEIYKEIQNERSSFI